MGNKDKEPCVCCDVCTCTHNVDGCKCNMNTIKITTTKENNKTHFCDSYECNCGFKAE